MKTRPLHRLAARLALALAALLTAAALLAPAAFADAGDYDEITNYVVTVDPRQDGSADITYEIDWKVIGGGAEDSLSWVTIGLANEYADEFENLSPDTVADVSLLTEGGSYAQVTFHDHYYAPDVAAQNGGESEVSFRFRVHQSHLFTENDDDTASFSFTPGWFDEICVDRLTVRWRNYDGFLAENHSVDGDYLVWEFGPLAHGERATVNVTVPITTAQVFDPANAMTGQENTPARPQSTGSRYDGAVALMTLLVVLFFAAIFYAGRPARWRGGFGGGYDPAAWVWYYNGANYIRMARGSRPPAGYHTSNPPPGFKAGGGETRGGGAGRDTSHHGSCVCACACVSCACACACAGGGRAGCSAKNFYRIRLPRRANEENDQ